MSASNRGRDPQGNPRSIPVKVGRGLVVWHSHEELARFQKGVDLEISRAMTRDPRRRPVDPNTCQEC